MIETRVRIVSADAGMAWVEPTEASGCGACQSKSSCGISGLGRFFSTRRPPVPVSCAGGARAGDELVLSVAEGELLLAGLFAYLLPALLAVLGAVLAGLAWSSDSAAALGALAGLSTGLVFARLLARAPQLRPAPDPFTQGETP